MKKHRTPKKTVATVSVVTVPCPAHGVPLETQEQDGKLIAVCNCGVKNNKHAGQVVYEATIDPKEK
jgi:hypothetical protein